MHRPIRVLRMHSTIVTVNPEICGNFIFANNDKRHICDAKKFATRPWFMYISKRQSDFVISRGFYFYETSHIRSFTINKTLVENSKFTVFCTCWCLLVNDSLISAFREDVIFTKLRENKTLAKNSTTAVFDYLWTLTWGVSWGIQWSMDHLYYSAS